MSKNIREINQTVTTLDGTERMYGYDSTNGNFKTIVPTTTDNYYATDFKQYIIDGDFNYWSNGTSGFTATGYTADMWRLALDSGTGSVIRQDVIDGNIPKYFLRFQMTSGANYTFIEQNLKDVALIADKNVSFFVRMKSSSGIADFKMSVGLHDGSSATYQNSSTTAIPNTDTWAWYRFDMTINDLSGLTITAGNHTQIRLWVVDAGAFILDFDRVRCIETPPGLEAGEIPDWVTNDENPELTKSLVRKYYTKLVGEIATTDPDPLTFGRGTSGNVAHLTTMLDVKMVQDPTITVTSDNSSLIDGTNGAVNTMSGSQTYSTVSTTENFIHYLISDPGVMTSNVYYYQIIRGDLSHSMEFDARY